MLVVIVALFVAVAVVRYFRSKAKNQREASYRSALQIYSQSLKPGLTRKEVEEYFRGKGVTFGQMCCIEERSAFADLVKVGEEAHPWYCSEHFVYIAFQFAATKPGPLGKLYDDTDVLKKVTIYHQLGGCL